MKMTVASGEIWVKVTMDVSQRILNGRGMLDKRKSSVIVPVFKGKGDMTSCRSYRGVKL